MNEKTITLTWSQVKSMFCTKADIEALAITGVHMPCVSGNAPYNWFEGGMPRERSVFRKMAKQMNFLRELKGQKPINKSSLLSDSDKKVIK